MNEIQIHKLFIEAIGKLIEKDSHLLVNDLSEQSITHKFAEYLQSLFPDYNVDCEYNGDVERENHKKRVSFLERKLISEPALEKNSDNSDSAVEKEYTEKAVFPDIIIHKRGSQ